MSDYSVTLSTTEPNNYVGLIKLRQGDVASQSIQATITANGQLFNFDHLAVFFNAVLPNGYVVRDKVTNVDYANSKLNYVVADSFLQEVAQVTAWFSFENDEKIIDRDLIKLPGIHNVENCLAAIMVCKEMGVSNKAICDVLTTFTGVEHRLEYVDTVDGVRYYNDTEATNIKCTQIALSSFDKDTTLILGGLERGQVFEDLTPYMTHVKNIVAIGQCRERVKEFGDSLHIPTYVYEKLEEGFKKCVEITKNGGIVLLSPASASWDQYKECEIRGAEFKQYVKGMKESEEDD